jgi:hypothetical protein
MWRREVRVAGSCSDPLYWHMQSFKTCNDFVEIGVKSFFEHVKVQQGHDVRATLASQPCQYYRRQLLSRQCSSLFLQ